MGHLIASIFGGSRDPEKNLAMQYDSFNRGPWETCENRIAKIVEKAVASGGCVKITVAINYMSDEKAIPYSFNIALEGIGYTLNSPFNVSYMHLRDADTNSRCKNTTENNG